MSNVSKNPRYNVISIRISEEERRNLDALVGRNGKSISAFMRQALVYYTARDDQFSN